jgi:hypothetical protein
MDLASESQTNLQQNGDETKQPATSPTQPIPAADHAPQVPDRTDPEWEAKKAKYKESIEAAFDALVPGMQISVNRTRPGWAAGWLDTIPVEFDENDRPMVDLQTIKDTFGGENLQLKFLTPNGQFLYAKTVHFRGIPPKENGLELENPQLRARRELMELEERNRIREDTKSTERLFKLMLERQDSSHKDMLHLIANANKQSTDPFNGMTNMFTLMEQFDRMRNHGGSGLGGDSNSLTDMLAGVMQMFGNMKNSAPQPHPQVPQYRLNPPSQRPMSPPSPRQQQQPPPPPQPMEQPFIPPAAQAAAAPPHPPAARPVAVPADAMDDFEEIDLVDEIVAMGDEDIADTVADLMDRLGDERGQRVLQIYLSGGSEQDTDGIEKTEQPPPTHPEENGE